MLIIFNKWTLRHIMPKTQTRVNFQKKYFGMFKVLYSKLHHLPPHSIVSEDAWIAPGLLQPLHWQSDALTTRLDLIHFRYVTCYVSSALG